MLTPTRAYLRYFMLMLIYVGQSKQNPLKQANPQNTTKKKMLKKAKRTKHKTQHAIF